MSLTPVSILSFVSYDDNSNDQSSFWIKSLRLFIGQSIPNYAYMISNAIFVFIRKKSSSPFASRLP